MITTMLNMRNAVLLLRYVIALSFLSAVADRFGIWGQAGEEGISWGNMNIFLDYTAILLPWVSRGISDFLGYMATLLEVILSVFLIIGLRLKETYLISFLLFSSFAISMMLFTGPKSALDYSVPTAMAASLLLFCMAKERSDDA